MNKKLEDFIQENKEKFDDYTPSDALWKRIERNLNHSPKKKTGKIFSFRDWMKIAAAAIILFAGFTLFLTWNRHEKVIAPPSTAFIDSSEKQQDTSEPVTAGNEFPTAIDTLENAPALADRKKGNNKNEFPEINEEELYHYSRLIEIKHNQMQALKKSEPELYKKFSKDLEMLETSYDALKGQLAQGVNNEKILEAMIGNLKMQTDLLNKQLEILKQVNNKKENDEKDYKSL